MSFLTVSGGGGGGFGVKGRFLIVWGDSGSGAVSLRREDCDDLTAAGDRVGASFRRELCEETRVAGLLCDARDAEGLAGGGAKRDGQ